MRTLVLALLLLATVFAGPANAREFVYANESRAADGLLYEAVRKADEFWRGKGYEPGCVRIFLASENGVVARASLNSDKVWFERSFVQHIRTSIASKDYIARLTAYEYLFLVAAHERGHNLGFRHDDSDIMGENPRLPGIGLDWAREKAA